MVCGKAEYENSGRSLASDTETYGGHFGKARELTKRAVDSALHADPRKPQPSGRRKPLREATFGNAAEASRVRKPGCGSFLRARVPKWKGRWRMPWRADAARPESMTQAGVNRKQASLHAIG